MISHIPYYIAAFLFTSFLIHIFRSPAEKIGLIDIPGGRKQHNNSIPLIGGIAIFLSFCFFILLIEEPMRHYSSLILGMGILVITGILDDLHDISAKMKILVQLLVAVLMVSWGDNVITNLGNLLGTGDILLGAWSIPFTILCTVGLINAINMLDGMDGLAGGVIVSNFIFLAIIISITGIDVELDVLLLLTAAVLAFLSFNLRHKWKVCATIFMGDAGSMMLGYALAWFVIDISNKSLSAVDMVSPITFALILALPVFDTIILIIRRLLKQKSPLSADREHLHHIFLRAGYSYENTVKILLSINALVSVIGISVWYFNVPSFISSLIFVLIFTLHLYFVMRAWRFMKAIKRLRKIRTA